MEPDVKARWDTDYAEDWVTKVIPRVVYAQALIEPELERLLGDVRGRRILDAGCGEGQYARHLKRLGASLVGVDGSQKMIRFARERDGDIEFAVADLLQPLDFASESFDAIVSAGVLMSLPRLDTFLTESMRILKRGGQFVISVNHPAFADPTMMMYQPSWRRWLGKPIVGVAFTYFTGHGTRGNGRRFPLYHRTIEEYVDAFRDSGFLLDRLTEPHQLAKDMLDRHNVEYVTRLPRFLFFKLVRP
jgi:ubiquinone/menaquinone biosynthesis C-methylase UbiE